MTVPIEPFSTGLRASAPSVVALPRRVRDVLSHLYALLSDDLSRQLERMLADFESQLFRAAEQARNPSVQSLHLETLRIVRHGHTALVPRFLSGLESGLGSIRKPAAAPVGTPEAATLNFSDLRLLDDHEASEETALRTLAMRHESRASLPLQLLGQRFGVLAGAPAFEAERLPVGPQRLGQLLLEASQDMAISAEARLQLLNTFDRLVLGGYEQLVEAMNALLAQHNVLPGLSFVPLRTRPRAEQRETPEAATDAKPRDRSAAASGASGAMPHTGWMGDAGVSDPSEEAEAFNSLQQLLSERRELLTRLRPASGAPAPVSRIALPTPDVLSVLGKLQGITPAAKTVAEVRQALLLQGRQQQGEPISLSREDSDTFELLGMLYAEIGRELREGAPNSHLLERLQVPLLRVALQDRAFFVHHHHPARQLLNAVAESGARWLADDDADPQLATQLRTAVDHVVDNYDGDSGVFEAANHALQEQLQTMARKAEVSERRYVDAARGKEKLALAKRHASEVIAQASRDQELPKFSRTLLNQAWADVLTLTMLRHGEDSEEWTQQLEATQQIVAANAGTAPAPQGLDGRVEEALTRVGYHVDEATVIARRLTAGTNEDEDDAASRTELAMKLKARARLGEDNETKPAALPPRTSMEQACYDQLRTLPFGTWFEFARNQQGDMVRRRLSWYSPITDNALFVNQRGQRVGEQSMDSLARMMAREQARIVTEDKGRLVDRAWQAALGALRHLTGKDDKSGKGSGLDGLAEQGA